jgi:hypothetical protein
VISVYRPAPDGCSREHWGFSVDADRSDRVNIVLRFYGTERRKSGRGKFAKALPEDRWSTMDERRYFSGQERPTSVPADVLAEARASIEISYFIANDRAENKISPLPAPPDNQ